jgi:hypothetical protein
MLLNFCPIRAGKASSTALADLACLVMDADCARGSRHRLRVPAAPRLRRDESSWQARHGAPKGLRHRAAPDPLKSPPVFPCGPIGVAGIISAAGPPLRAWSPARPAGRGQ